MSFLKGLMMANPRIAKGIYNLAGYPRLGLMTHDMYCPMKNPVIKEAISRLPDDVRAQRIMRINRAITLSITHKELPRNEWMTPEKDTPYMEEYIAAVEAERALLAEFREKIFSFDSVKSIQKEPTYKALPAAEHK